METQVQTEKRAPILIMAGDTVLARYNANAVRRRWKVAGVDQVRGLIEATNESVRNGKIVSIPFDMVDKVEIAEAALFGSLKQRAAAPLAALDAALDELAEHGCAAFEVAGRRYSIGETLRDARQASRTPNIATYRDTEAGGLFWCEELPGSGSAKVVDPA